MESSSYKKHLKTHESKDTDTTNSENSQEQDSTKVDDEITDTPSGSGADEQVEIQSQGE